MEAIPLPQLALSLSPLVIAGWLHWRWCGDRSTTAIASLRMVLQLLLIGYLLQALFNAEHLWSVGLVLTVMLVASSWIAMRPLTVRKSGVATDIAIAIGVSSLFCLAIVVGLVLSPDPWFRPAVVIPIAGMAFSNAMNAVSLAAERLESELQHKDFTNLHSARGSAFNAAMLPQYNTLFAVGLVALPGMMTGQILAGVSPLVAVRYQIVIMAMVAGGSGIAAGAYLAQRIRRSMAAGLPLN